MRTWKGICMLVLCLPGAPAWPAVVSVSASGFAVHHEVEFKGTPEQAWQRLVRPQDWWSPDHTYSGDSANMSLALEPGGCWCEKLANGGFVRHMQVVYAEPGRALRMTGGLGPLQGMGGGAALTVVLKPGDGGIVKVVADFVATAYAADGFSKFAAGVDAVLGEQFARLVRQP